jgi:hypothetical protein
LPDPVGRIPTRSCPSRVVAAHPVLPGLVRAFFPWSCQRDGSVLLAGSPDVMRAPAEVSAGARKVVAEGYCW